MSPKDAIRAFFAAFDQKRRSAKSGIWIGAFMDVLHRYQCPITRLGKSYGPCDCGGDEQKTQVKDAMETLREFAK